MRLLEDSIFMHLWHFLGVILIYKTLKICGDITKTVALITKQRDKEIRFLDEKSVRFMSNEYL